jgi:hypothetical protein
MGISMLAVRSLRFADGSLVQFGGYFISSPGI